MNEAYETCKRCNKVAGCFFLIISSVDRDMITKTVTFSIVEDFGFSMSPRDLYYQFHKNAPLRQVDQNVTISQVDISGAKKNSAVAGLLRSAMLPLQQVVDGRCSPVIQLSPLF